MAFRDPHSWASVSAFAAISNPTKCPWGQKAFESYLGSVDAGKDHDATLLLKADGPFEEYDDILIDQGMGDEFLEDGQLLPENLEEAAANVGQPLTVRRHDGYDHSYYFVSSFIDDHIKFHSSRIWAAHGKRLAKAASESDAQVSDTAGKPITCQAMVARAPKEPLTLETITVDPPKAGAE